jgi:hypothetical protein
MVVAAYPHCRASVCLFRHLANLVRDMGHLRLATGLEVLWKGFPRPPKSFADTGQAEADVEGESVTIDVSIGRVDGRNLALFDR